jgi:hypothetical protein
MFKGFIAWLDSYISREEPSSVLKALVGLMTFAGLLGTVFGNQAIRAGAFVVVIFLVISTIILVLDDRRRLSQECETHRDLVGRYCNLIANDGNDPAISIETWQQSISIAPNGDVREVLRIRAVALREKVFFIRLTAGSRWSQPDRHRHGVTVTARSLTADGRSGPRWNVTTWWDSMEKMTWILHLRQPINRGEFVLFQVVRTWPAKCQPLMHDGRPEDFTLCTSKLLKVKHVEYRIALPPGFEAVYELIGAAEPDVQLTADTDYDDEGRLVFTWRTDDVPTSAKVGIRIELKQPTYRPVTRSTHAFGSPRLRIRRRARQSGSRWARQDSNLRPLGCKPSALPLSYTPRWDITKWRSPSSRLLGCGRRRAGCARRTERHRPDRSGTCPGSTCRPSR